MTIFPTDDKNFDTEIRSSVFVSHKHTVLSSIAQFDLRQGQGGRVFVR